VRADGTGLVSRAGTLLLRELTVETGIFVVSLEPDGPAGRAGIRDGLLHRLHDERRRRRGRRDRNRGNASVSAGRKAVFVPEGESDSEQGRWDPGKSALAVVGGGR